MNVENKFQLSFPGYENYIKMIVKCLPDVLEMSMKPIEEKISENVKRFYSNITPNVLQTALNASLGQTMHQVSCSVAKTIPNLRIVSSEYEQLPKVFCIAVEQLMRTLDFPVIQPEITRDQLEKRLEQMDDTKMLQATSSTIKAIRNAPITENKKKSLIKMVKSGILIIAVPYLINVASDLTSDAIKNKVNQIKNEQQIYQNTDKNTNIIINNYNINLSDIDRETNKFSQERNYDCNNGTNQYATKESLPSIATSTLESDQ